ncbi:flagellar basal body P-ring formation chaperone FlgA [Shewanella surugensis]|uniref:Flagella basal body P-ring formation protein FlgA n=1 Tax=Shewanella surugensis TaxID=212020 RepID=A0ABT0LAX3_9GAMM|nr:flagellar basal body P-ring formation chaperone FlgA [Shewanella surugensis]MCL1124790.1 flagellar basal body P-ring formation chaperone FlgA [Shewanella surugensis]
MRLWLAGCTLTSGLLMLPVQAESATVQQLEARMTQVLSQELKQWQQHAGVKDLTKKITVRVPSGAEKLTLCPKSPTINSADIDFGQVQRKLSCPSLGWSLYVRAKVQVSARLPVFKRAMKRGEQVKGQDITWMKLALKGSDKEVLTQASDIIGRQMVRKLHRYKPIKAMYLGAPVLVKLGDKVIIEAKSQGFYAKMFGEALESGREGEAIRVKNLSSGKIITAYPTSKGKVTTHF